MRTEKEQSSQPSAKNAAIPPQTMARMPYYLGFLHKLQENGESHVSAPMIAREMKLNDVQVRKDLALVARAGGRPKTGFLVKELIEDIEDNLGYHNTDDAVLVGAGHLGTALLSYKGFAAYGMNIVAAFDVDESRIGQSVDGKPVYAMSRLSEICCQLNVHIGIITVPADAAQDVCDQLLEAGVMGIWNFSPTHLNAPEHVCLQNENMAASLAMLSKHLSANLAPLKAKKARTAGPGDQA